MIKKILLVVFLGSLITSAVSTNFVLAQELEYPKPDTEIEEDQPSPQSVNGCLTGNFQQLVSCVVSTILNPLVVLLVGVAILVLTWGIVKYIGSGADATKRKEGGQLVAYGIFGIFIMLSIWGLVGLLTNTFFGESGPAKNPPIPTITTS